MKQTIFPKLLFVFVLSILMPIIGGNLLHAQTSLDVRLTWTDSNNDSIPDKTYNRRAQDVAEGMTVYHADTLLIEGVDYTVNGITNPKNAGEYSFYVRGNGIYAGMENEVFFQILKKKLGNGTTTPAEGIEILLDGDCIDKEDNGNVSYENIAKHLFVRHNGDTLYFNRNNIAHYANEYQFTTSVSDNKSGSITIIGGGSSSYISYNYEGTVIKNFKLTTGVNFPGLTDESGENPWSTYYYPKNTHLSITDQPLSVYYIVNASMPNDTTTGVVEINSIDFIPQYRPVLICYNSDEVDNRTDNDKENGIFHLSVYNGTDSPPSLFYIKDEKGFSSVNSNTRVGDLEGNVRYVMTGKEFVLLDADDEDIFPAHRCYLWFKVANPKFAAKKLRISFDQTNSLNPIQDSSNPRASGNTIYDLQGRRINISDIHLLPNGIYIQNGKKIAR